MNNIQVMFSKDSDEWGTPQALFDELNKEFSFTLDPCATAENHKCPKYFSMAEDGLKQNWGGSGYSVIHHIAKLISGLLKPFMRLETITLSWCY